MFRIAWLDIICFRKMQQYHVQSINAVYFREKGKKYRWCVVHWRKLGFDMNEIRYLCSTTTLYKKNVLLSGTFHAPWKGIEVAFFDVQEVAFRTKIKISSMAFCRKKYETKTFKWINEMSNLETCWIFLNMEGTIFNWKMKLKISKVLTIFSRVRNIS